MQFSYMHLYIDQAVFQLQEVRQYLEKFIIKLLSKLANSLGNDVGNLPEGLVAPVRISVNALPNS